MASTFLSNRTLLATGAVVPLAVLVGYLLAEPFQLGSLALLVLVLSVLISPLILRWHHALVVVAWNAAISLNFLPGSPPLWMPLTFISVLLVFLNRSVEQKWAVKQVASITVPLLALFSVVVLTATLRGGLGVRALGAETHGGKGYFYIVAAVAGFFALSNGKVPVERRDFYAGLFFLPGLTALLSNLVFLMGPGFWWLYTIFPSSSAGEQAMGAYSLDQTISRFLGLSPASIALYSWILARWGLRKVTDWRRPWRIFLFAMAWAACLACGFRSVLLFFLLASVFQFVLEGLHRTRLLAIMLSMAAVAGCLVMAFAEHLPLVVQRTVSVLPVRVNPFVRASVQGSSEWRIDMWRDLWPQVPRYLWLGKGYAINPNELNLALESSMRGLGNRHQAASVAGDYHNGPFSLIIPFGLWGAVTFAWFLVASLRYLYRNYRYGNPGLRPLNTALLSLFAAKAVFFLLVVGGFWRDLGIFLGLLGLAVCMNRADRPAIPAATLGLQPGNNAQERTVSGARKDHSEGGRDKHAIRDDLNGE